jgi:hypothetical protein
VRLLGLSTPHQAPEDGQVELCEEARLAASIALKQQQEYAEMLLELGEGDKFSVVESSH